MSFNATVYKVMIASPSDVQSERSIIREVIHEWNAVNSTNRATVLLPVGWETHSSPSMGGRAQDVINRQVLADCDLLVAVFWTRVGTPTGEFQSGTIEEIEKHVGQGKETMIYFSSVPVRPDSVDEKQYAALQEFRRRCRDRGLVDEYDSLSDFGTKFARQLGLKVIEICGRSSAETASVLAADAARSTFMPILSRDAKRLLATAARDQHRTILKLRTFSGLSVSSGGTDFVEQGDARSEARWENAVAELVEKELIRDVGYKGEVYEVTARGFDVADMLTAVYG